MKPQIAKKEAILRSAHRENEDLQKQLEMLEQQIVDKNHEIINVELDIVQHQKENEKTIVNLEEEISKVKKETHEMKADYNRKIDSAR